MSVKKKGGDKTALFCKICRRKSRDCVNARFQYAALYLIIIICNLASTL